MNVFKKIIGVLLIVCAVILSLSILVTIKNSFIDATNVTNEEGKSQGIAYLLGCLVGILIFIFLTRYLYIKGFKMLKGNKQTVDSIEEIGKVE